MRHIIPISGKDSLCTAIVQITKEPNKEYEFVFNPTGSELPEVFEWIEKVEKNLNIKINQVGENLDEIIKSYNYFLPSGNSRYCTRQSKIEPFVKWINGDECNVYYGIRADENRKGFNNSKTPNITPIYPLVEMGIDLRGVYSILAVRELKPPTFFWESIFNEVQSRTDLDIISHLPEWVFDVLFAWRSRANCDKCFNQRYYEWVGLLEHYPDRFNHASEMEKMGNKDVEGYKFTWSSNLKSLEDIRAESYFIKGKRINYIIKYIENYRQYKLFDNIVDYDQLAGVSCGLFCAK